MKASIAFTMIALAGCASNQRVPSLADFEYGCSTVYPFSELGPCLQRVMDYRIPNWQAGKNADLRQTYVAWLVAAGQKIHEGTMTEADARLGAATIKTRLIEIELQRNANEAISQQVAMNRALAGLALMQQSTYTLPSSTAPTYPITCRTSAPNKITGQVYTTCQ